MATIFYTGLILMPNNPCTPLGSQILMPPSPIQPAAVKPWPWLDMEMDLHGNIQEAAQAECLLADCVASGR